MNRDDVISLDKRLSFLGASTFTVEEARDKLAEFVENRANISAQVWKGDGIKCQVMQVGSGRWKKGKVRISLEFILDEEELKLDQEAELVVEDAPFKQLESLLDKISRQDY